MQIIDLSLWKMALIIGSAAVPIGLIALLGVRLVRDSFIGIVRMVLQLALVGLYLKFLFDINQWYLTGLWMLVMVLVANFTILRQAGLVTESRDGRRRLYRLRAEALNLIGSWLQSVETHRVGGAQLPPATAAAPRAARRRRPKAGLRPLRRDEPEEKDWRTW